MSEVRSRTLSVGTILNVVFVVLATGLAASLLVNMAGAWSELGQSKRILALTAVDRALFETTQAIRLTRGASQATLQTTDDARSELEKTRSQTDALLKATLGRIDSELLKDGATRVAEILRRWEAVEPFHRQMLAIAGKPRADRDMKETEDWYKAVGNVVAGLSDISRSIANEARLSDEIIGEFVLARQYSWAIRESLGDECSASRAQFGLNKPPGPDLRERLAGLRGAAYRSYAMLDDLLARPGAPPALVEAMLGTPQPGLF